MTNHVIIKAVFKQLNFSSKVWVAITVHDDRVIARRTVGL